ncbi:hypothetical protein PLIIFM63780_010600 [Purpureocillium lilacinum]|nr:hypothetical protein PLIIFM63780_010600 [Purpureocillium lilacinum]
MDHSTANELGIKLGITLTSVGDTKAYIATNYNGVGQVRASAATLHQSVSRKLEHSKMGG